jgi:hypothetical protein
MAVLHSFQTDVEVGSTGPWTDYWTDFESENAIEKVLQLATELVQVVIDQSYSLSPLGPSTKFPSQIIGPAGPLDKLLDRF